ncbi:MAG: glycosyltransferase [Candidatus Marinimicrobia bacterium]|nr:glycosyltransferase [Candidatus Neomarinimicrobiota bacterium]
MSDTINQVSDKHVNRETAAHKSEPLISVVIPTYKRKVLLERSLQSVFDQTYDNWEVIVSDDEEETGETWNYLKELSQRDPRIRPIKNPGVNGQVHNTNNALRHARGQWIKLLHDDDRLKPDCLTELIAVVNNFNTRKIACVTCGVDRFEGGNVKSPGRRAGWPLIEIIPQDQIHTVMYMAEDAGGAAPSQKMIHRRVVDQGGFMEKPEGLNILVDSWFNAEIGQHGDLVLYRKPLVEWHQGEHETESDGLDLSGAENEFYILRHKLWDKIVDKSHLPPPEIMNQMIAMQRSLIRIRRGQIKEGLKILSGIRSIRAFWEYLHWGWHNISKGRVSYGKRIRVEI